MTGQVTSEIAEPDSTATYDLDTLSKHGAVKCIGGASAAGGGKDYHDKGKRGEGESIGAADALKEKAKALAEVATTSNVAEVEETRTANFKIEKAQEAAREKAVHVELETTNVKEGGPKNKEGLSTCTPPKHKHPLGLMLHSVLKKKVVP